MVRPPQDSMRCSPDSSVDCSQHAHGGVCISRARCRSGMSSSRCHVACPACRPHVAKVDLWKTSGHYDFYRENMFDQMDIEDEQYQLRPM